VAGQITELLQRACAGDASASDELMPALYAELHRIAESHFRRERPDHTLQPTALVHEAYLRIFSQTHPHFANRAHFLALASRVMRRILVDHARTRSAEKRGGELRQVATGADFDVAAGGADRLVQLLDLDRAIEALAAGNPEPAQVMEMRYFGGMTAEETSEVVGRSVHTVRHELRFAQAWLRRRLAGMRVEGP